jgi:hypothetical protein
VPEKSVSNLELAMGLPLEYEDHGLDARWRKWPPWCDD